MVRYCSVANCTSNARKHKDISFHFFPKFGKHKILINNDTGSKHFIDRLVAWNLKLNNHKPIKSYMRVCSLHFNEDDYFYKDETKRKKRILKSTAVPSKNLPMDGNVHGIKSRSRSKTVRMQKRIFVFIQENVSENTAEDVPCEYSKTEYYEQKIEAIEDIFEML